MGENAGAQMRAAARSVDLGDFFWASGPRECYGAAASPCEREHGGTCERSSKVRLLVALACQPET